MEILTLIINAFIAVGTIGACVISLYIARKNLRDQTEEKCTVEANYAVRTPEHGFMTGKRGNLVNSAIQVCVYNSGLRNLYVQSVSIGYRGRYLLIPKDFYANSLNDQEVVSGYRIPFHILLSDLKSNQELMKFYVRNCHGHGIQIVVETVFKNKYYAKIPLYDFNKIDKIMEITNQPRE